MMCRVAVAAVAAGALIVIASPTPVIPVIYILVASVLAARLIAGCIDKAKRLGRSQALADAERFAERFARARGQSAD